MNSINHGNKEVEDRINSSKNWMNISLNDSLSPESLFVTFVFFIVLSQFILYGRFESISQPLRPLIVLILAVQVVRRGRINISVCNVALAMSIYQFLIWFFFYPSGGSLPQYLVLIFYFMMLFSVAGFPWNRRELQFILYATFLATFVCAAVFFFSNNMTDFTEHQMYFMGTAVNRNKNAYCFAFGFVLGRLFFKYGDKKSKPLILLIMLFEGYCLLYSQCRGAFIGLTLSLFIGFISRLIYMKRMDNPFLLFYILLFIIVCLVGYSLIVNSAVHRLVDSEHLSGRDAGMEHALLLFRQAPLLRKIFGNGLLFEGANTEGIGVHNVYLTYLLEAGIIGTTFVILIFLQAARIIHGEIQWSIFILALSRTFFEGMDYYIFIPLIFSICLSNYEWLFGRSCSELFKSRKSLDYDNDF